MCQLCIKEGLFVPKASKKKIPRVTTPLLVNGIELTIDPAIIVPSPTSIIALGQSDIDPVNMNIANDNHVSDGLDARNT